MWHSPRECTWSFVVLIYVNSLPCQITESLLLQYADDTTFIYSGPTPEAGAGAMNLQL